MRGSIAKKGKKWYAVVYDGPDPLTGKDRRRWVMAGTRKGGAEKLLAELIQRKYEGETVVNERVTLGEYLVHRWLPIQATRVRPSTYDSYVRNTRLHVQPALAAGRSTSSPSRTSTCSTPGSSPRGTSARAAQRGCGPCRSATST